jgi:hypothetical protein
VLQKTHPTFWAARKRAQKHEGWGTRKGKNNKAEGE